MITNAMNFNTYNTSDIGNVVKTHYYIHIDMDFAFSFFQVH